jgi:hypothetical protein
VGAAPSPTINNLIADLDGQALGWPNYGYDKSTASIVLTLDTLLAVSCFLAITLVYHWSKTESDSDRRLHGARDAKFRINKFKDAYVEEVDC